MEKLKSEKQAYDAMSEFYKFMLKKEKAGFENKDCEHNYF